MIDQLLITGLFVCLLASLIFTDWHAVWDFTCTMLSSYF